MIKSMTGFGRAEKKVGELDLSVEIRSVNSRFLEIVSRAPRGMESLEDKARLKVQNRIPRGRIIVTLNLGNGKVQPGTPHLNRLILKKYRDIVAEAGSILGSEADLELPDILALPDVISLELDPSDLATLEQAMDGLMGEALDQLDTMRKREGELLEKAIMDQIRNMSEVVTRIKAWDDGRLEEVTGRLKKRINELSIDQDVPLDGQRMQQEILFWADRLDITEELVRLEAHIEHFLDLMKKDEDAGKRMNFLLQEMNREANTVGSKAYSTEISHAVVEIKNEIERIREQVQNIQ